MKRNNANTKQVTPETEAWKKILGFLQQENILQKNKLVVMLGNNHEKDEVLLEIAEQYQYQFLQQDETFRLMWNEIAGLEKLIEENGSDKTRARKISHRQKKLKKEVEALEINFDKLKSRFNNFVEAIKERIN
jgi:vacuolar-type H+-ATPase catalytic subunit A/Vma1